MKTLTVICLGYICLPTAVVFARRINEYVPRHTEGIIVKALRSTGLDVKDAKVAILGAAYKGGINDTRESPTKYIVRELLEKEQE
jgi:UDP-N-acetyl-D-mannosaminuronic acid dehydrogenase